MVGKNCVAIACDLRLGNQALTVACNFEKVAPPAPPSPNRESERADPLGRDASLTRRTPHQVFSATERTYFGLPGLASDTLTVRDKLRQRVNLYAMKEERTIEPETFCHLVSSTLYERRCVSSLPCYIPLLHSLLPEGLVVRGLSLAIARPRLAVLALTGRLLTRNCSTSPRCVSRQVWPVFRRAGRGRCAPSYLESELRNVVSDPRAGSPASAPETGLNSKDEPFIAATDLIGCINFAKVCSPSRSQEADFEKSDPLIVPSSHHPPQDFVVSGTASEKLFGMAESLWEPDLPAEDLFETVSQTLLNAVDRDAYSGWGAVVWIIEKVRVPGLAD